MATPAMPSMPDQLNTNLTGILSEIEKVHAKVKSYQNRSVVIQNPSEIDALLAKIDSLSERLAVTADCIKSVVNPEKSNELKLKLSMSESILTDVRVSIPAVMDVYASTIRATTAGGMGGGKSASSAAAFSGAALPAPVVLDAHLIGTRNQFPLVGDGEYVDSVPCTCCSSVFLTQVLAMEKSSDITPEHIDGWTLQGKKHFADLICAKKEEGAIVEEGSIVEHQGFSLPEIVNDARYDELTLVSDPAFPVTNGKDPEYCKDVGHLYLAGDPAKAGFIPVKDRLYKPVLEKVLSYPLPTAVVLEKAGGTTSFIYLPTTKEIIFYDSHGNTEVSGGKKEAYVGVIKSVDTPAGKLKALNFLEKFIPMRDGSSNEINYHIVQPTVGVEFAPPIPLVVDLTEGDAVTRANSEGYKTKSAKYFEGIQSREAGLLDCPPYEEITPETIGSQKDALLEGLEERIMQTRLLLADINEHPYFIDVDGVRGDVAALLEAFVETKSRISAIVPARVDVSKSFYERSKIDDLLDPMLVKISEGTHTAVDVFTFLYEIAKHGGFKESEIGDKFINPAKLAFYLIAAKGDTSDPDWTGTNIAKNIYTPVLSHFLKYLAKLAKFHKASYDYESFTNITLALALEFGLKDPDKMVEAVKGHYWVLGGRSEGDPDWSKTHIKDHPDKLVKAMLEVYQETTPTKM